MKTLIMSIIASAAIATAVAQENFTYKFGDSSLTLLSDGQGRGNPSILIGATPEMIAGAAPEGTYPNATNAFLYRTPDRVVLIDTGLGRNLLKNLAIEGVSPKDVDAILITHTHGDHIGGLTADGKALFPNAELYLSNKEYKWVEEEGNDRTKSALNAYDERLKTFEPNPLTDKGSVEELMPNITAFAAYGHTPGHTVYMLGARRDHILVWGDVTHAMAVQMPYPGVSVTYDSDPVQAARSRAIILELCADGMTPLAGMHIAAPGMGEVKKDGKGYIFTPLVQ